MNFINFNAIDFDERNKFNEEIANLNMQKAEQISLLSSFLAANKDVFHSAYMFDFNSISDVSQLNGEFDYWIRSLRDARRNTERTSNLNRILNNFYVKLADIYNKINEANRNYAKYESEHKNNLNDEDLRPSVEYINSITEIGNRIGEKRNNIAIIINYMKNIDTEDFMKNDHRKMVENLQNEINLDMAEICKLLSSRNFDIDSYRIFRSNISRNVANMGGTSLSFCNETYDVLYHEYDVLSEMLRSGRKSMDEVPQPVEIHEEPTPIPSEETPIELPPVDNNPIDNNTENEVPESFEELNPSNDDIPVEGDDLGDDPLDEVPLNDDSLNDESLDDSPLDDDLDDEVEREPVKNSPLSQFRDKFKRSVKGISKASGKLKGKIDAKVFRKAALRWTGVVGVLAVAAVINPALLLGGAAVGAGLYEYHVAKKMK